MSYEGLEKKTGIMETLTDALTAVVLAGTNLVFINLLNNSYSNNNKQVLTSVAFSIKIH